MGASSAFFSAFFPVTFGHFSAKFRPFLFFILPLYDIIGQA
jgi:uncharacterized membrane protein